MLLLYEDYDNEESVTKLIRNTSKKTILRVRVMILEISISKSINLCSSKSRKFFFYFSSYMRGTSGMKNVKIIFSRSEVDKNDQEGFLIRWVWNAHAHERSYEREGELYTPTHTLFIYSFLFLFFFYICINTNNCCNHLSITLFFLIII